MTVTVANSLSNSTFGFLRARVNELADAVTTKAVTTDSNTAAGNAAITGTFTANVGIFTNGITVTGNTGNVDIANFTSNTVAANTANLVSLWSSVANLVTLTVNSAVANVCNVTTFRATTGNVVTLSSNSANITTLSVNTATIANLIATAFSVTNFAANTLVVGNSSVNVTFTAANATAQANGGYYFNANGSYVYIAPFSTPGSNTQIIFNDSGNINASASLLYFKSNTTFSTSNLIANNLTYAGSVALQGGGSVLFAGLSQQTLDAIDLAVYRSAEYVCQLKDNNGLTYGVTKILLSCNGSATTVTEYGGTGTIPGTFDGGTNATHSTLLFTPTSSSVTCKYSRTALAL